MTVPLLACTSESFVVLYIRHVDLLFIKFSALIFRTLAGSGPLEPVTVVKITKHLMGIFSKFVSIAYELIQSFNVKRYSLFIRLSY